jgi:hypothetical protein
MATVSVDPKTNTVTIKIVVPLPIGGLPLIHLGFPPHLPQLRIPVVPEALKTLAKILAQLQQVINKLLALIPQGAIHLIVKLGPATIIDQTFTSADALSAALGATLCK